jgi:23S rRNA pseudouridine1911/1915/1917 synthase
MIRYGPRTGRRKVFYARLFKGLSRQALHAKTLGFRHPKSGDEMDFTSELPDDMAQALIELRRVASTMP